MQTWTLTGHGKPAAVLQLQQREKPEPGANEVRIHCEGFGLNYADVMAVKGLYREAPPLPSVLGYEVVGRVEAVGSGTPATLIGKRVVAMTRFGGYAEFAIADHRAMAEIPEDMPLGEAAALATQGCTAWYAARVLCPLRKGERVLVHSAAGGVGHLLVQLAVAQGCEVYAVASAKVEPEAKSRAAGTKGDYLRGLGAKHVIDRTQGDYAAQVRTLLNGNTLDAVFNAVGGSSFKKDMRMLGGGGRIVLFGGAERGGIGFLGTLRFVWRMGLVIPIFLMMRSRSILGLNMLRISEGHPQLLAECQHAVVKAYREGTLKPRVHKEYPATELPLALADLESGRTMGKVVLRW